MDADAIVIGAGAAGLSAARTLLQHSLRVIVVEARDRVGGRVRSERRSGATIELGAEFIHGSATETMELLRICDSTSVASVGESWTQRAGKLTRDDWDFASVGRLFTGLESLEPDETVAKYFSTDANKAAVEFVEGFDAADAAVASVRSIATEWSCGVDSVSARPLGQYGRLFDYLRDAAIAAGAKILLSSIVRRIRRATGNVAIDIQSADGRSRTLRARVAIVTLPIGVLRYRGDDCAVTFEPALPQSAQTALTYLEMGDVVRIALIFKTPFWEMLRGGDYRNAAFFRAERQPFNAYWTQFPVRRNFLIAWAGGQKATALRKLSETERAAQAIEGLAQLFADCSIVYSELEANVTHDWMTDPFARGAYSYVRVGGSDARPALATPIDNTLFFAGEAVASDGQGGTVNGALRSGVTAARRAVAAIAAGQPINGA